MIVVMKRDASDGQVDAVREAIERGGLRSVRMGDDDQTVVVGVADEGRPELAADRLTGLTGIELLLPASPPYRLASLQARPSGTRVRIGAHCVGGPAPFLIAGPCSVEGLDMLLETASSVQASGAHALRAGAFKPRTSPYAFQGLRHEGLDMLAEVRRATGLPTVTEVLDPRHVDAVAARVDVLQVGARNMYNYELLKELGRTRRPIILKRAPSATVRELLLAAEYVLSQGNGQIVLCERGIRTFDDAMRNTLDVGAIAVLKRETHLPVIVDPSHAAGRSELVPALALAAIAGGADGLLVEVHPDPARALSDAGQQLLPEAFARLVDAVWAVYHGSRGSDASRTRVAS